MIQEQKSQLQRETEQLLVERSMVKEVMNKACHYVPCLAQEGQELIEVQVMKLVETIQELQVRITELEIQAILSTPHEVHNQREQATKNVAIRIRSITTECK